MWLDPRLLLRKALFSTAIIVSSISVNAAPVTFTYSTAVSTNGYGNTLILKITADNGGIGIASGSWAQEDILSAVATVGSYEAIFNYPYFQNDPVFVTDSLGNLASTRWYDIDDNNTDNIGAGSPVFYANVLETSQRDRLTYLDAGPSSASSWEISAVPIPAAAWLFGSALIGLVGIKRKK